MYAEHSEFIIEKTKNLPYWRYMDFWKFLDLINTSSLFFPNIEMLGDQHEGKIPQEIYEQAIDVGRILRDNNYAKNHYESIYNLRKRILISSWNASDTESFAMWKMYAKDKLGVAIKTNYERLKNSIDKCPETIHIGEVRYYDNKKPKYKLGRPLYTFMTKHGYYDFESEVRCLTLLTAEDTSLSKSIKVDLNLLIEEVYISPFASKTGIIDIINFLMKKNNLDFKINISGVNDNWL